MGSHDSDSQAEDVQQLQWTQSPSPYVDEDGGQFGLAIGITDVEDGAVASSDIDTSGASVSLAKSTGGGSFSTSGITQPSLSTSDGVVTVETDFVASEWAAGDSYRVSVSGITATTGDGNTVELPEQRWYGSVSEESDITSQINTLHNTRIPDIISRANIQAEAEDALLADLSTDSPATSSVVDVLSNDLEPRLPGSGTLSTHAWDPDGVVPGSGTLATQAEQWKRGTNSPDQASTTLSDNTETTVLDLGTDGSSTGRELRSAILDVTLGSHTAVSLAVKVDINGTLTEIDAANVSSDGAVDLFEHLAIDNIASPHIRITATGDTSSPSTNGTVDHTAEFSEAT